MTSESTATDVYISTSAVAQRYGIHVRTLWTWMADPASGFPAPLNVRGKLRHHLGELIAWEKTHRVPAAKVVEAA